MTATDTYRVTAADLAEVNEALRQFLLQNELDRRSDRHELLAEFLEGVASTARYVCGKPGDRASAQAIVAVRATALKIRHRAMHEFRG